MAEAPKARGQWAPPQANRANPQGLVPTTPHPQTANSLEGPLLGEVGPLRTGSPLPGGGGGGGGAGRRDRVQGGLSTPVATHRQQSLVTVEATALWSWGAAVCSCSFGMDASCAIASGLFPWRCVQVEDQIHLACVVLPAAGARVGDVFSAA